MVGCMILRTHSVKEETLGSSSCPTSFKPWSAAPEVACVAGGLSPVPPHAVCSAPDNYSLYPRSSWLDEAMQQDVLGLESEAGGLHVLVSCSTRLQYFSTSD